MDDFFAVLYGNDRVGWRVLREIDGRVRVFETYLSACGAVENERVVWPFAFPVRVRRLKIYDDSGDCVLECIEWGSISLLL